MHKKKAKSNGFSPKELLRDLRDGKKPEIQPKQKHKKNVVSIEMNGIELSDMGHSRRDSELSEVLLPSHEKKRHISKTEEELTIEEVIGKVFPEFMKQDEKTNQSKINWRHFDKSALKDIFGKTGRKLLQGKRFVDKLTVPSQTFLQNDEDRRDSNVSNRSDEPDERASHQLSYKKLLKYIDSQHPREDYVDKETHRRKKKLFGMNITTGNYLFENEPNQLENYGLGLALYFKYVKYLIILFLGLFIINLPALLIFFFNRNSYPQQKSTDMLNNVLFKTTLGNIGGEQAICGKPTYIHDDPDIQRLYFQCPENMRIVSFFGLSLRNTSNCKIPQDTFTSLLQDEYVDACEDQILAQTKLEQLCDHQANCTISFNIKQIPANCTAKSDTFSSFENPYLNGYAMCEEFYINFPGLRGLEKKSIYYLFVFIDLCSVILYTIGFFWIVKQEKREENQFKSNLLSSEQYTIKIAGFDKIQNIWEYINDLVDYLQENSPQTEDLTISDINFVTFDKEYIEIKHKIGFTLRKIHTLEALIEKARKDKLEDRLVNGMFELHHRCDEELKFCYRNLEKIELCKPLNVKYIFITFNKAAASEDVLRKFYEPATKRNLAKLHIYFDKEEWRYFKGKRLIVKRAPPASNIKWNAISASKFNVELRRVGIFIIEFLLIFACFYFLMYKQIQDNYYLELLGKEECSKVYSESEVLNNWDNKKVLKCFCEQNFRGTLEEQLANSRSFTFNMQRDNFECNADASDNDPFYHYQRNSACYDYFSTIDQFNGFGNWLELQYGRKLFVASANGLIALVSLFFAKLMKRPTISSELKESTKGAFLMQFLTLGWLALLSNIDSFRKMWEYFTPQSEPLFRVMCKDFSVKFEGHSVFTLHWFFTNGTGLIMTLFLSAFTYQLSVIIVFLAFRFYRWFDRGFSSDMKRTRKLIQSDYNKVYKGPIISLDNSYATLLTFLFVVMMFAPALPILYLIAALAFTILYWLDKYLQLRFYCNPPRLDERFAREMRRIVPYSILLHLAFGILIFGSYHIAPPSDDNLHIHAGDFLLGNETTTETTQDNKIVNELFSDIILFYRESRYHTFVSILGFLTLGLFFLLMGKMFFWDLIKAAGRNIAAYKRIYTRKITINLEMDFIEAIETSYLVEKIQLMEKMQKHSCFTLEYEAKFQKILQMYKQELKKRDRRQTYTKIKQYIKDVPFYSMELSDEFRKEFGVDYSRHLEYTVDEDEKWNKRL